MSVWSGMSQRVARFLNPMSQHGVPEFDPATLQPITVYWRPGCGFCGSLINGLKRLDVPFTAVNIWDNEEAAAFVRGVARGNETVPTVSVGTEAFVNPSVTQVIAAAAAIRPSAD
jgi:mycoredoxin